MVGPNPRYVDDGDYVGGFSRTDIAGLLDALDANHLGWSAQMAPVIMGNPDHPELAEELTNSFCRTDPDIARQFARVTFLSDNRADLPTVRRPHARAAVQRGRHRPRGRRPVRARAGARAACSPSSRRPATAPPERPGGDDGRDPRLPAGVTRDRLQRSGGPGPDAARRSSAGCSRRTRPTSTRTRRWGTSRRCPTAGSSRSTGRSAPGPAGRPRSLIGARFQDLLSIGGQVFHETHLVAAAADAGRRARDRPGRRPRRRVGAAVPAQRRRAAGRRRRAAAGAGHAVRGDRAAALRARAAGGAAGGRGVGGAVA